MNCPNDNTQLVMAERSGVEIDYCPKCRGVWLDRGELDKIIDRSSPQAQADQDYKSRSGTGHSSRDGNYHKPKKKESFLSDLFDF